MITLDALLATEALSVSVDIAWTCAGSLASGYTVEVWPSFPQSLQRTLVGFLTEEVERELLLRDEPSSFVLFLGLLGNRRSTLRSTEIFLHGGR